MLRRLGLAVGLLLTCLLITSCGHGNAHVWATHPQTEPVGLCVSGNCGFYSVTLRWDSSITVPGITGYYVYVNGSEVADTPSQPYTLYGLACATTFTIGIQAHDGSGHLSALSTMTYTTGTCSPPQPAPPTNSVLPAISGTPVSGDTLTASTGTWSNNSPQTYTYQWQDCDVNGANCTNVTGATANTYTLSGP